MLPFSIRGLTRWFAESQTDLCGLKITGIALTTLVGHGVVEVSAETVFAGAPRWGSCPGQGEFEATPGEPVAGDWLQGYGRTGLYLTSPCELISTFLQAPLLPRAPC